MEEVLEEELAKRQETEENEEEALSQMPKREVKKFAKEKRQAENTKKQAEAHRKRVAKLKEEAREQKELPELQARQKGLRRKLFIEASAGQEGNNLQHPAYLHMFHN